jgi:hypothetical protein
MAGYPSDVPEAGSSALPRCHRGGGHRLHAEIQTGVIGRACATSYWHVQWNTEAGQVIPACVIPAGRG